MSERPCFFSKTKSWREKGCRKPAKYRVILGDGYTIDVCEVHVLPYRVMGLKIVELLEAKV
jgi:hypothetical protein